MDSGPQRVVGGLSTRDKDGTICLFPRAVGDEREYLLFLSFS